MRVIANAGGNLPDAVLKDHRIGSAPMRFVVDDVSHEITSSVGFEQVEAWIRSARTYPQSHGGNAAELLELLRVASAEDPELLVVTASRHIVGSYTSATSAARVLAARPRARGTIEVVDTGFVDIGIGMPALFAAEAIRAGRPAAEVATLTRRFAAGGSFGVVPDTLDYLVKAGRATMLKAWLAGALSLRPLIGVVGGEMKVVENVRRSADGVVGGLLGYATRTIEPRRAVWVGILHAAAPALAAQLEARVRETFDVRCSFVRPFHPAVYLGVGPGALGLFVAPVDRLPWTPPPNLTR